LLWLTNNIELNFCGYGLSISLGQCQNFKWQLPNPERESSHQNCLVTTDEQATLFITTPDFMCMLQKYVNAYRCVLSPFVNIIVVLLQLFFKIH
jgi:hypothetical protein